MNGPSIEGHAWVEVDLDALARNARTLSRRAGVPLLPMVKADAYGLGVVPVVRALEPLDPWGYGVATIAEGIAIRASGVTRPIVVFTPQLPAAYGALRAASLTPSLGTADEIAAWDRGGPWHLAIDTGMHRAGIRWDAVGPLAAALTTDPPEGAYTHLHSAELADGSAAVQVTRFREALAAMPARPAVLHVENSPAVERLTGRSDWSCVRPGLFLYGVGTGGGLAPEPVVRLLAAVVQLRTVRAGESVGYDATYIAPTTRRVATLAAGYGDGYRRALSGVGRVRIGDHDVQILGTVTMDMCMVDVTDVPCAVGDRATLIGGGAPGDGPSVAAVAARAGLSPYEVLVGLALRAPRTYAGGGRGHPRAVAGYAMGADEGGS